LIRPAEKEEIQVIARYDFDGRVSAAFVFIHISSPTVSLAELCWVNLDIKGVDG